jgi:preprotein translocase subunit SecG
MLAMPILAAGFFISLVMVLFVICAVALILIILIQKGKGGGLSGALAGGAMSNILGSQAKGPLTWITIGLISTFLILAILLAKFYKPSMSVTAPKQTSAPTAPAPKNPAPVKPVEVPAAVPPVTDANAGK